MSPPLPPNPRPQRIPPPPPHTHTHWQGVRHITDQWRRKNRKGGREKLAEGGTAENQENRKVLSQELTDRAELAR